MAQAELNARLQPYLTRYAQPEIAAVRDLNAGEHESVLVIPCYDEAPRFLETLLPAKTSNLLVILVINAPDNAPIDAQARTTHLLESLCSATPEPFNMVSYAPSRNVNLLIIDRVSGKRLIPHRQGVGLARKIGADVALALIATKHVQNPWIYATDADVSLPEDYLHTSMPDTGTALFPFRHVSRDRELLMRAQLYELHLRFYVNQLASAGSPYAFHTLGSTTAIHANSYAKVRGYPRRNAGEDFYLLNKLAKVDPIHLLGNPATNAAEITIHARHSKRVPFGTGPALEKIPERPHAYPSYALASFTLLREVLTGIAGVVRGNAWEASRETDTVLESLGFFTALHNARQHTRRPDTLRNSLHQWFDGFRTLRFIHECRRFHGDESLLDTLAKIAGPDRLDSSDSCQSYLHWLRHAERPGTRGLH
jgi:hypothetical protein